MNPTEPKRAKTPGWTSGREGAKGRRFGPAGLVLAVCLSAIGVQESFGQPPGACCLGNGSCITTTDQADCDTVSGEYLGDGTTCIGSVCTGACCIADDACTEGNADACASGMFQGAGSACATHCAGPLGTGFTYQGQLKQNGGPLTGVVDLEASLWTAALGGDPVGGTLTLSAVNVTNGLFTLELDFGHAAFDGDTRFLEVAVRSPHDPTDTQPFTTLSPRQPVTAAPYALNALNAPDGHSLDAADSDPTDAVFVDNDGNVGIGTTSPENLLHLKGPRYKVLLESLGNVDLALGRGTSSHFANLQFADGAPAAGANLRWAIGLRGTGASSKLHFFDEMNSRFVMTLTHGGNVGIGTTQPGYPLHVETDTSSAAIYGYYQLTNGLSAGVWGQSDSSAGRGVYGFAAADSGENVGVYGQSQSSAGYDFYAGGAGMDYGSSSSIRWKRNIEPIRDPLDKVARLRGVYFDWDEEHGGHHAIGMIAEEVGKVLPEIVNYEENGTDAVGMDYSKLTPLLIEAVKEQQQQIETLRADHDRKLTQKDAEIAELRDRVARFERLVGRLAQVGMEENR